MTAKYVLLAIGWLFFLPLWLLWDATAEMLRYVSKDRLRAWRCFTNRHNERELRSDVASKNQILMMNTLAPRSYFKVLPVADRPDLLEGLYYTCSHCKGFLHEWEGRDEA